jgi:hypothetical protein
MSKVQTTKGLIDRAELTVNEIVDEDDTARYIKTEWYLGDELVRRDAWVNLKQGITMKVEGANLG